VIFCEGFAALVTAEALEAVAVFTELAARGLAVVAGHCEISLSFTAALPDNDFARSISASAVVDSFVPVSV
jgi:hypothetical protein